MKTYRFQILDVQSDDIDMSKGDKTQNQFLMTFYGKTNIENEENPGFQKNIVCKVTGFRPFFYIRIPKDWWPIPTFMKRLRNFHTNIRNKFNSSFLEEGNYRGHKCTYKNFYGYNYDENAEGEDKIKKYDFIKLEYDSYTDMKRCCAVIKDYYNTNLEHVRVGKIIKSMNKQGVLQFEDVEDDLKEWFLQTHNCDCEANLYESKLHPMLRYLHLRNITSAGWVEVKTKSNPLLGSNKQYHTDIEIHAYENQLYPCQEGDSAKFITASFDIECDSSHGSFPNPIKDFKGTAIEIHESLKPHSQVGIEFSRKIIIEAIKKAFQLENKYPESIQSIFSDNGVPSQDSLTKLEEKLDDNLMQTIIDSYEDKKKRESCIQELTQIFNKHLINEKKEPIRIQGDPIIQIGTVFHKYGDKTCYNRSIVVIGNGETEREQICSPIEGVDVYPCLSEKELLLKWRDIMLYHNPDFITGYNIFGFDFEYISKRVDVLFPCNSYCKKGRWAKCSYNCEKNKFYRLGRLMRSSNDAVLEKPNTMETFQETGITSKQYTKHREKQCKMVSKELSSSGLGDNILKYIFMDGRIVFDVQKEIQKGHALESYKLDNVSAHFMKGTILDDPKPRILLSKELDENGKRLRKTILHVTSLGNLKEGDYVTFKLYTKFGEIKLNQNKKYEILKLVNEDSKKYFTVNGRISVSKYEKDNSLIRYEWCLAKDDVSPQQIFDFHKHSGKDGRAKIAKYCIMDCELCIHLLQHQDIIPNNMGMASVSSVPTSYIFLRGQGIKIFSLVSKVCNQKNTRIPTLTQFNGDNNDGFEGAIVLEPKPGIYSEDPVSVLDFASLYPNSIREINASHETFIGTREEIDANKDKYQWLDSVKYREISYDDYEYVKKGKTLHKVKKGTQTTCLFAKEDKQDENTKGIIPLILETLLNQRKETRKKIKTEKDPAKQKVLDGFQLAYKVTANSVYGQTGASTSAVRFKKLAASTTAVGRERIGDAEQGVKDWAKEKGYKEPEVVYGDTDSVFVKFSRWDPKTKKVLEGREALRHCIDCGIKAGEWITETKWKKSNSPQDLEYEKTFWPFILISKKRYTGDKYEFDHIKPKERTSMGIVMKRRDNAPIVKYVFGNVIEIIMKDKSVEKAVEWLGTCLQQIKDGGMDETMFIITKSLSAYYKNPEGIAHKVLADRMAERNPGNKPKPNDRIPFMYQKVNEEPIKVGMFKNGKPKFKKRKILQGDRVEHPDFIKENNIPIDYNFYISNQIMKPVKQVLDLELDEEKTKDFFSQYLH